MRIAKATRPDVVLMDLQLGTGSGVDATREITAALPDTRVLVLSASGEQADVLDAVKGGASGYLVKSASLDDLVDAVRRTAAGDAVFGPGLAGLVLGEYHRIESEPDVPRLTERETEVLRLVARGLTAKQIAAPAGAVPPHRREPRPEHAAEAPAPQPRRTRPLRPRTRSRRGARVG